MQKSFQKPTLIGYKRSFDMDLVSFPSSLDRAGWHWPVSDLTHTKGRDRMQNKTNKDYCALCTLQKKNQSQTLPGAEDSEGRMGTLFLHV